MPVQFMDIGMPIGSINSMGPYITPQDTISEFSGVGSNNGFSNGAVNGFLRDNMPYGTDIYNMDEWVNYLRNEASKGNSAAFDKLFNYIASETSAKTARDWTAEREDNQYQRLMDDLREAGISPYILSNAIPGASGARQNSYSGSQMTEREKSQLNNETSLIGRIIQVLGYLIGGIAGKAIPNTNITMKK